jgi:hypothetical protein
VSRSIFQIWQPKKHNFYLNFFFIFFLYLFNFFNSTFLLCDDLVKIVIDNIHIRYSPSISPLRLYNSFYHIKNYVINNSNSEFKFDIYKYMRLDGSLFPHNHVYNHYHINYVHYGFSLTHNIRNLNLLPHEYYIFNYRNLYEKDQIQYILNDLRIYDLNILKPKNNSEIFEQFLLEYNNKIINHYKKIIK